MASKNAGVIDTYKAGADVTEKRFVKITAADTVQHSGAGATAIGVTEHTVTSGNYVAVAITGRTIVTAGDAVTAGADVTSDSTGRAVPATTGNYINGTAKTAASTAGDEIEVVLADGKATAA